MNESPRALRLRSSARGIVIVVILFVYGWLVRQPQGAFIEGLLIAAALQAGVLLARRFAPVARLPQAVYILELLADGVTVLLFALGVLGGIATPPSDF